MAKSSPPDIPNIEPNDHQKYMELALSLARLSPPRPSNFRVGAVLLDSNSNNILSTGYTLELEGNTHAEQCCLAKFAAKHSLSAESYAELSTILPDNAVLYTTMEPCIKRLSGNVSCTERILQLAGKVSTVYVGVSEPETFVGRNEGREKLGAAGIKVVHVPGLEEEILSVATAGHVKE